MIFPSNRNYVLRANPGLQSSSTPVRFPVAVILVVVLRVTRLSDDMRSSGVPELPGTSLLGVELLRFLVARIFCDGMLNQGLAAAGGEETTSNTTEEGEAQMYPDVIVKCLVAT